MKFFVMTTAKRSDKYTDYALRTFFSATTLDPEDRFILIDNDHSFEKFRLAQLRQVELAHNRAPRGFAENINQVLRRARATKADLYVLGNDVIFSRDWLRPLLLDEPFILSPLSNRHACYESDFFSTSAEMDLTQYQGREAAFEKLAHTHRFKFFGLQGVPAFCFFCAKIPAAVQERLGFLDSAFDDATDASFDYCLRAHLAGFEVKFAQPSYVLHFGASAGSQAPPRGSRLRDKWGDRLVQVLAENSQDALDEDSRLASLVSRRRFRDLIERLMPSPAPVVRVNESE